MRTTALLYHDVVPDEKYELSGFQSADANIYKLSRAEFRRHLDVWANESPIKPEILGHTTAGGVDRRLLITFDDGGLSALTEAGPMLEEYGWRGYFFITTDYIGDTGFLDAEGIRTLHQRGHVIGSHSCSHPLLMGACSTEQLEREWKDSVHKLEDILGAPVTTASIPGGYYRPPVAVAAGLAGIRTLFTSEPTTRVEAVGGVSTIGRFSIQQGVSAEWMARVVADEKLPRIRQYVAWNGKKALKAVGGQVWLKFRKHVLAARAGTK